MGKENTYYLGIKNILRNWLYFKTNFSNISEIHIQSVRLFYKSLARLEKEDYAILYEKYIQYSDFKVIEDPITGRNKQSNITKIVSSKQIAKEKGISLNVYRDQLLTATYRLENHYKSLQGEERFKKYEEYFLGDFVAYINRNLQTKEYRIYFHLTSVLQESEVEEKAFAMDKFRIPN
ncbi:hypothetical protein BW721_08570 [Jeotgalibaca sp. PTS2502]|uniref:hypothetical protein n=1 Tax=Jeotgalibaca sp. PTS2502 TaxID=1903686 RepID=UPI00097379BC|nr:hypothetical protein [Jeotgalibaca sp. PTS2502]APZ49708.1 hypothetical protein BW721_08570 [Jeotgalibaca sp. PTS2502]